MLQRKFAFSDFDRTVVAGPVHNARIYFLGITVHALYAVPAHLVPVFIKNNFAFFDDYGKAIAGIVLLNGNIGVGLYGKKPFVLAHDHVAFRPAFFAS